MVLLVLKCHMALWRKWRKLMPCNVRLQYLFRMTIIKYCVLKLEVIYYQKKHENNDGFPRKALSLHYSFIKIISTSA